MKLITKEVRMDNQSVVINELIDNNWEADGNTISKSYKIITQKSYPLSGALITQGGRPRFRKGHWKVTVGKRTTYFYQLDKNKQVNNGHHFSTTKDIDKIRQFANSI
jgi:hypothetical protein